MKKFVILGIIILCFINCKESREFDNCKSKIDKTEICLPKIKGLDNIYEKKDEAVYIKYSDIISTFSTIGNGLLAFYVENSDNGYSCLYFNKKVDYDLSKDEYKEMSETMGKYLKKVDFLEILMIM